MSPEIAWIFAPAGASLTLALAVGPVRRAVWDGWFCLARYDVLWILPASLTAAYGIFHLLVTGLYLWRSGAGWPDLFLPPPPGLPELAVDRLPETVLPSAEMLAGALNGLVATFPLSALLGFLFLVNGRGAAGDLRRALCRRAGPFGGILFALVLLCALAAVLKPAAFLVLPELEAAIGPSRFFLAATGVNALAFVFEYLAGTAIQLYLLLTAYGWVRGRHFPRERLLRFAVRRLGFVIKWALVLIVATLLFIHLPLLIEVALTGAPATARTEWVVRPLLALGMLACPAVQIRLALHNDRLRDALGANVAFLRQKAAVTVVFLACALGLLVTLKGVELAGLCWLDTTLAGAAWALGWQILAAATGGWILACWVCLYTRLTGAVAPIAY